MKKTLLLLALAGIAFSSSAQTRVPDEIGVLAVENGKYWNTPSGLRFDVCESFSLKPCPKSSWVTLSQYVARRAGKNAYAFQIDQDRFFGIHIFYRITPTKP